MKNELSCKTCNSLSKKYFTKTPDKKGRVMCERCFEKSKDRIVYVDLPYQPIGNYIEKMKARIESYRGINEELLGPDTTRP